MIIQDINFYLFAHRLRVGHCCTEEAIHLQPPIKPRPVIVSVPGVRKTPGDQGVELPVHRLTGFALGAGAHATQAAIVALTILLVMMGVAPASVTHTHCSYHSYSR